MIKNTWVNLPVKSLKDSVKFFEKLGFKFNKQFNATNMLLNDNTMVTLVEEPQFKEFAQKEVADTKTTSEAVLVLQVESKDAVNELVDDYEIARFHFLATRPARRDRDPVRYPDPLQCVNVGTIIDG